MFLRKVFLCGFALFANISVNSQTDQEQEFSITQVIPLLDISITNAMAACNGFGGDLLVCAPKPGAGGGKDDGGEEEEDDDEEAKRQQREEREQDRIQTCIATVDELVDKCKMTYGATHVVGAFLCANPMFGALKIGMCESTLAGLDLAAQNWCEEQGEAKIKRECTPRK